MGTAIYYSAEKRQELLDECTLLQYDAAHERL